MPHCFFPFSTAGYSMPFHRRRPSSQAGASADNSWIVPDRPARVRQKDPGPPLPRTWRRPLKNSASCRPPALPDTRRSRAFLVIQLPFAGRQFESNGTTGSFLPFTRSRSISRTSTSESPAEPSPDRRVVLILPAGSPEVVHARARWILRRSRGSTQAVGQRASEYVPNIDLQSTVIATGQS